MVCRWWSWFDVISWPDTLAMYMASYMSGRENKDVAHTIENITDFQTLDNRVKDDLGDTFLDHAIATKKFHFAKVTYF